MSGFYSKWSRIYSLIFDNPPLVRGIRKEAVDAMHLEKGDRVLEIGCGTGGNFRHIQQEIGSEGKMVGVDISEGMLDKAENKVKRNNWENVELIQGDGAEVEINEQFDAVLFSFCINFFEPEEIIEKWVSKIEEGYIVNAHGSRPAGRFAKPLNLLAKVITILSIPPIYKFRYEEDIIQNIEENLEKSHKKFEEVSENVDRKKKAFGLVEIDSGEIK